MSRAGLNRDYWDGYAACLDDVERFATSDYPCDCPAFDLIGAADVIENRRF